MSGYPLLDVFWTIVLFFGFVLWIFLVTWTLFDVFGSPDIAGWAKAGWTALVILVPMIGVLAYVIVHKDHVSGWHGRASGATSSAFKLSKLADLHDRGVIDDAEFEREKENILR